MLRIIHRWWPGESVMWKVLSCDVTMLQIIRDQPRFAPSQWETLLQCKDVSHWLGPYRDSSLQSLVGYDAACQSSRIISQGHDGRGMDMRLTHEPGAEFIFEIIKSYLHFISFLPEASFGLRVLSLPPCVRQSWACLCDNSSQVWVWITKFGQKNAKYFAQGPYCFWDWLGLTFQVKFYFIEKLCLFASLLHLWHICETCLSN